MNTCPVYSWCVSEHTSNHPDDVNSHIARVQFGVFDGGEPRMMRAHYHPDDGLTFSIDTAGEWELAPGDIDREIAERSRRSRSRSRRCSSSPQRSTRKR